MEAMPLPTADHDCMLAGTQNDFVRRMLLLRALRRMRLLDVALARKSVRFVRFIFPLLYVQRDH